MKIKNILAVSALALTTLASCSKWTDMEIQHPEDLTQPNHSEAYYKALRDYKNSDHQIAFSYYSAWTGVGTNMQSSLMGLPDSVDLVSLWGGWKNPTEAQLKDLRDAQQKKGLKAMICFLVLDMGAGVTPDLRRPKRHHFRMVRLGLTSTGAGARSRRPKVRLLAVPLSSSTLMRSATSSISMAMMVSISMLSQTILTPSVRTMKCGVPM